VASATKLTRKELYEEVWATPMVKVAERYGLSDRGLAKLCERHKIPVPGRGYWRKSETGQPVKRRRLPTTVDAKLAEILITPIPSYDGSEDPEVTKQLAYEENHLITVPERLNDPHRLVALTRDHLQACLRGTDGTLRSRAAPLRVRVSPDQISRALRVSDSLLKACEERGFAVTVPDEHHPDARLRVHGEDLAVRLEECSRRTEHVLTPKEQEERRRGHGSNIPRYDYEPTGVLTFTIDEYAEGLRRRWSDRRNRPLESCLNEIIVAIVRIALTVLRPRRLERERENQRWLREARHQERERARLEALTKNLQAWKSNRDLRSFLAAVETAAGGRQGQISKDRSMDRWLQWAYKLAEQTDPLNGFVAAVSKGKWTETSGSEDD
jgi:hypothetical protein